MSLEEIKKKVEEGQKQLAKGIFPDEVLLSINDERLRKDVSDQIFNPAGVKFDDLSHEEKKQRKARLKVKLSFIEYEGSFGMFSIAAWLTLIIGFVTFVTAVIGMNDNLMYGIISMVVGIPILFISVKKELILKYILIVSIVYAAIYIIEVATLLIPDPYLFEPKDDIISSRRGALAKIFNLLTPFIYVTFRVISGAAFIIALRRQKNFFRDKTEFESGKA
jgi:hypothetical protein